jgi:hypothetical protein
MAGTLMPADGMITGNPSAELEFLMAQVKVRAVGLAVSLAVSLGLVGTAAMAASSASSAVSDSFATSVGSISTSIQKSSDSSSSKDDKVAEGDYRIIEIAAAPARAGMVRLKLQAVAAEAGKAGEFFLYMPQEAFEQSHLAAGHVVTARPRAYGLQFTRAASEDAFFLVLDDERHRELQTRPVQL